jgi:hypothetical protein
MQPAEPNKLTVLSREDLYAKVWKTPMCRLAKEFGISDVGLAKICRKHAVPTPPRGYWAMLEHGIKVNQPKLPMVGDTSLQAIRIRRGIQPEIMHEERVSSLSRDIPFRIQYCQGHGRTISLLWQSGEPRQYHTQMQSLTEIALEKAVQGAFTRP